MSVPEPIAAVLPARTLRVELALQFKLALPIVVVQLGMMLMGVVDTAMVGHFGRAGEGAAAISAVSQANLLFMGGSTIAMGILMGLDPVLAQALGAGDRGAFARGVQRGFITIPLLSLLVATPLVASGWLLDVLAQPSDVRSIAVTYCWITLPSVPFMLGFVVLRQALQVAERLAPILWTVAIANVANVFLDYILIHGHLGSPALGAGGSALASTACRVMMFGALAVFAWPTLAPLVLPLERRALALVPLVRLFRIGASVGAQNLLEFAAFGAVAVAMGWLGTVEQAGHMVAMNMAAVSFMVPLGVATAASVRVGKAVGRGDGDGARLAARCALVMGVSFMCASGALFAAVPGLLADLYTDEPPVHLVAATLLPLAAAFQLFDGTQVVGLGVLRGAGDTLVPALVNLFGYWIVGIPLGMWLTFRADLGYTGLWWGLVAGLAVVAIVLVLRISRRLRNIGARVDLDR